MKAWGLRIRGRISVYQTVLQAGVALSWVVACRASQPQPEANPCKSEEGKPKSKLLEPIAHKQKSARPHLAGAVLRLVGEARHLLTNQESVLSVNMQ